MTTNFNPTSIRASNKATRIREFLDLSAWDEDIVPELLKEKSRCQELLVSAVLDSTHTAGTPEQLAGRIYGIDYVIKFITRILERGAKADIELKREGSN